MPRRRSSPDPLDADDLPPDTPCFVCIRDNGAAPREQKSIEEQLAVIEEFATEHGWAIVDRLVNQAPNASNEVREPPISRTDQPPRDRTNP